jgi:hypothetical protein
MRERLLIPVFVTLPILAASALAAQAGSAFPASILPPMAVVKFSTTNTDGKPVPCELTLAKMRAVLASVAPSSSNKARFEYLKSRGIERCHANDDQQANAYLSEALGMVGR